MITITQRPTVINFAYNPIMIGLKSTEQTRTDFKYVFEIRDKNDVIMSTVKKVGGTNVNDITYIDVSKFLQRQHFFNYWRYTRQGSEFIYKDNNTFRIPFSVLCWEYYSGAKSAWEVINGVYTMPVSMPAIRFGNFDYPTSIYSSGRWMSNFKEVKVRKDDPLTLTAFAPVNGIAHFYIDFYNTSDTLLQSFFINNPYAYPQIVENVVHLHAGFQDVKALTGLSDAVAANVAYYKIRPDTGAGTPIKIILVEQDCRFKGVRVHYLNEWGGVDSFLFNLASRRSVTIEKKKAKLPLTGSPLRPSIYGQGNTPYIVNFSDTLKLTSDYITENDSNALLEMFTSPMVAIECEESLFYTSATNKKLILPADIEVNNYDIKQTSIDRLFNLELELKLSVSNSRQSL